MHSDPASIFTEKSSLTLRASATALKLPYLLPFIEMCALASNPSRKRMIVSADQILIPSLHFSDVCGGAASTVVTISDLLSTLASCGMLRELLPSFMIVGREQAPGCSCNEVWTSFISVKH